MMMMMIVVIMMIYDFHWMMMMERQTTTKKTKSSRNWINEFIYHVEMVINGFFFNLFESIDHYYCYYCRFIQISGATLLHNLEINWQKKNFCFNCFCCFNEFFFFFFGIIYIFFLYAKKNQFQDKRSLFICCFTFCEWKKKNWLIDSLKNSSDQKFISIIFW